MSALALQAKRTVFGFEVEDQIVGIQRNSDGLSMQHPEFKEGHFVVNDQLPSMAVSLTDDTRSSKAAFRIQQVMEDGIVCG